MQHTVEILAIEPLTSDTMRYKTTKPEGYNFKPGQATNVALDIDDWRDEQRPFTFTSLPQDKTLEFVIKSYPEHDGMTEQLKQVVVGDNLLISEPWGAMEYKGKGTFVAGGAGITPFLPIFRQLSDNGELAGNRLIFGNKTEADIIARNELETFPNLEKIYVLSDENKEGFAHGVIDKELLSASIKDMSAPIYVCGPPSMMEGVEDALDQLGASAVSFDK